MVPSVALAGSEEKRALRDRMQRDDPLIGTVEDRLFGELCALAFIRNLISRMCRHKKLVVGPERGTAVPQIVCGRWRRASTGSGRGDPCP